MALDFYGSDSSTEESQPTPSNWEKIFIDELAYVINIEKKNVFLENY